MVYVVGIDENGFGPILGPLVVTATVFELKEPYTPNYFWESLSSVISKTSKSFPQKITVYNSKEVFKPRHSKSYEALETTVLTFFNLLFKNSPQSFKDFFSQVSLNSYTNPESLDKVYTERSRSARDKLSRRACPQDLAIGEVCRDINFSLPVWANNWPRRNQERLEEELAKAEIKILGVKSVLVCPGQFNEGLNQFGSKFYLNFLQFKELIKWVLDSYSPQDLVFLCGKIGSQKNYLGLLKKGYFKDLEVKPEVQSSKISTYNFSSASSTCPPSRLAGGSRRDFSLSFIRGGDKYHFPIALASLFGKYIREVFMRHQNLVFQKQDPSLKPVSGYRDPLTHDFIKNTQGLRKKLKIPEKCFIRQK